MLIGIDSDSLFTNVPLDKTNDTSIDSLYNKNDNTPKIPKDIFRNLLNLATKESLFMFINKFYKKLMVWLWVLHWIQLWLTFLCAVLKING